MRHALGIACVLAFAASTASAAPAVRLGLTFALADQGAPGQHELGPLVGIGTRLGPVLLEADYAFLSFMEPDTGPGGMHRLGVNVRADLYRDDTRPCIPLLACTRALAFYAEVGAGMRYGQWHLDANTRSPETDRQREAHVGLGVEMDNTLFPRRYGWQLGVRFAIAPRGDVMVACRGMGCSAAGMVEGGSSLDRSVLVEWTFLLGR